MPTLNPGEQYPLTYTIPDKADLNTYYVRSFVRSGSTLIESVDLDDMTGGRFLKNWQVPADGSGSGKWIDIETICYTDAGYTTLNNIYGAKHEQFLIQRRMNPDRLGGGAGIDYERIRTMVKSEIANIPPSEKVNLPDVEAITRRVIKEIPATDLTRVLETVDNLKFDIPKAISDDLMARMSPLQVEIGAIRDICTQMVSDTGQTKSDLLGALQEAVSELKTNYEDAHVQDKLNEAINSIRDFFGKYMEKKDSTDARIEEVSKQIGKIAYLVLSPGGDKGADDGLNKATPGINAL